MAWFISRSDGAFYDIYGKVVTAEQVESFRNARPDTGIVVDAGVSGRSSYIAVYDLDTKRYTIRRFNHAHDPAVAELMAIAMGVSHAGWKRPQVCIHCDNSQAVIWAMGRYAMDPTKYSWMDVMAYDCAMEIISARPRWMLIRPWYTNNWGENPADFQWQRQKTAPKEKEKENNKEKKKKRKRKRKRKHGKEQEMG